MKVKRLFGLLVAVGMGGGLLAAPQANEESRTESRMVVGIVDVCPARGKTGISTIYAEALARAGHTSLVLPRVADANTLAAQLRQLDLVLFCGGEDIEPWRYGMEKSPRCEQNNPERDAFDWRVLDECVRVRKPVFGICRGLQLINCYFGGTLYQDIFTEVPGVMRHRFVPGEKRDYVMHDLTVLEGSRLAAVLGAGTISACSKHHQAVRRLASGFRVAARTADGIVEAIESDRYPAAAVQFHPEQNVQRDPNTRLLALFRKLQSLCAATP